MYLTTAKQGQPITANHQNNVQDTHVFSTTVSVGAAHACGDKPGHDLLPLEPLTNVTYRGLADEMPRDIWLKNENPTRTKK